MTSANDEGQSEPIPEDEDAILTRMARRIRGAQSNPSPKRLEREYLVTDQEDFWDRNLNTLVLETLRLGLARFRGLSNVEAVMTSVFQTTSPLLMGYIQLGAHVNNLALTSWMPANSLPAAKVQALAQLHARALVILEEAFVLTFTGYPSGATALARTLHEVRVTARFLHRFESRLAERYLASHIVDMWKNKNDFAPRGAAQRSKAWRETERELDDRYADIVRKYGESMAFENGWAAPRFDKNRQKPHRPRRIPFAWIEREVKRPHDREWYRLGSRQVHAVHLGSIQTLAGGARGVALLGPRPFGLANAAIQASWDAQDVAESLLRSCGHLGEHKGEVYYWLEALDQLSHVIRASVTDAQTTLDSLRPYVDEE